jgi:hypothetical protein
MNLDSRVRADSAQQHLEIARPERNTAGGRFEARPSDMDEHRTAASGDARPRIVIDLDDEIVEAVRAPEPVAWFIGRPLESVVVAPVARIFTPRVGDADAANTQKRSGARQPVGPPPQPQGPKPPARRTTIAFPFVGFDAGAAKRNGHGKRTGAEPAL